MKCEPTMQIENESNYVPKANSAFIDNHPNVKFYTMLINNAILCNNTVLPLILTNYSDNTFCIPKDITIGTPEEIGCNWYNINEITITTRIRDIET